MLTGIRKLNVSPSRLTALALLTVVAITLLNACGGGDSGSGDDSGEDSPMMMVMPILRTITTPPAPSGTQKLEVLDEDGTHQNMEFDRFGSTAVRYAITHRKNLYGDIVGT